MAATADDYAWFGDLYLAQSFCLTLVRGPGPVEVLDLLGGVAPVEAVSVGLVERAAEVVSGVTYEAHDHSVGFVAATPLGAWTMILEPNGFLCGDDALLTTLSHRGESLSLYHNDNTTPRFTWARDGAVVVSFAPTDPGERRGSDPDRLVEIMADLGFDRRVDPGDDGDEEFLGRTLALLDRMTGSSFTPDTFEAATFHCSVAPESHPWVPPAAEPSRFLREVHEEVVAFVADPDAVRETTIARRRREQQDRRDEELRRDNEDRYWGSRAPDDQRLRDVAPYAVGLAHVDRDLVDQIAAAEPSVQRAMAVWAARRICERAGMLGLDWVAEAVGALDRGDPPPPSFADFDTALARWKGVARDDVTHPETVTAGAWHKPRIPPESTAIHTVEVARHGDPLIAALTAAYNLTRVDPTAIAALRTAFGIPPCTPE